MYESRYYCIHCIGKLKGFQRSESIGLIHCMEHPIDLRGIGMLEHSVQLIRKELSSGIPLEIINVNRLMMK